MSKVVLQASPQPTQELGDIPEELILSNEYLNEFILLLIPLSNEYLNELNLTSGVPRLTFDPIVKRILK